MMAIGLTVTKDSLESLFVDLSLTGLTIGTRYDLYRLQIRYLGDNDVGARVYERELPDRAALWSAVAHRVSWAATAATASVRDYECPTRPHQYFLVPSSLVGPYEYDFAGGTYPVERGVLNPTVVHFEKDWEENETELNALHKPGHVVIRSTSELAKMASACVVDMPDLKYQARGTEFAVIGRQYPLYIADTREARRGSLTIKVDTLGQYDDVRDIIFPPSGRIVPVLLQSGGDNTLLLDDMTVIPLDVSVEQITPGNADLRYIHLDYVEVDKTAPLHVRIGDNDLLVAKPKAVITVNATNPRKKVAIKFDSTSTGQFDSYEWTWGANTSNRVGKSYSKGPHWIYWTTTGRKTVTLRVYGQAGAHSATKVITVRA